jgi:hypothetical protein
MPGIKETFMKKIVWLMLPLTTILLLAACASQPSQSASTPSSRSSSRGSSNLELLEDKGSAMGVSAPSWVEAAVQDDYTALKKDPRFEGKTPFVFSGQGQDLDITQSWVTNFIAGGAISRQISTAVNAKFEGGLKGGDDANKMKKLQEIVATLSRTEINGMAREMDWWRLNRRKDTGAETYTYFVVYSISTENLNYQIAQAMGKISAQAADEKELVDDMKAALNELEFGGIIQAEE